MNKLYLVRHGENMANITQEFSHRIVDYPLTSKGRIQAEQTAEYFKDKHIHAIFTSPLKRAIETAQMIAHSTDLPYTIVEEFRELNVGDLESMSDLQEAWRIHLGVWMEWIGGNREARFPGGENSLIACERMQIGLDIAVDNRENQNIIIVGHGGQFTACLCDLCPKASFADLLSQQSNNCSITEIDLIREDNVWRGELVRWADISHLHGSAADLVAGYPKE